MNNQKKRNTEELLERYRTHVLHGTACPVVLREEVWNLAATSTGALLKRYPAALSRLTYYEKQEVYTDVIIAFLEFLIENPRKPVGYLFKVFKLRFSDLVTRLEARKLGIALKPAPSIRSYEVSKLKKVLENSRKGLTYHPVVSPLQKGTIEFSSEIEESENGEFSLPEGEIDGDYILGNAI